MTLDDYVMMAFGLVLMVAAFAPFAARPKGSRAAFRPATKARAIFLVGLFAFGLGVTRWLSR